MKLWEWKHDMFMAMPAPIRIYAGTGGKQTCPVTVRRGGKWLDSLGFSKEQPLAVKAALQSPHKRADDSLAIELRDVWFKYEKNSPDVIKGLSMRIGIGEILRYRGRERFGQNNGLKYCCRHLQGLSREVLCSVRMELPDAGNDFLCGWLHCRKTRRRFL
jgi:energy-coupling factor transport system ATP-binding protein